MRQTIRKLYNRKLAQRVSLCNNDELAQPAIVFAPHPDDETLGCGGTILSRRALGAPVWVVFLTDGRSSHSHLIPAAELASIRRQEATQACAALNVSAEYVIHLDFPDGDLNSYTAEATDKIAALLREINPKAIYFPHFAEPPADHQATYQSVMAARNAVAANITAYGYPIWLWQQWPWVSLHADNRYERQMLWHNIRHMRVGWRLVTELDTAVDIREYNHEKRQALAQHRSQMTSLRPNWPTLNSVSQGQFIPLFFQSFEYFRKF